MPSRRLKPVGPKLGVQDGAAAMGGTQINPYLPGTGWDVVFQTADYAIPETEFEIYHISLDGPVGSSVVVLIDAIEWGYALVGWSNEWDPSQVMKLTSGNQVAFCWNFAFAAGPYNRTSNVQPRVTLWPQRLSEIQ